MIISATITDATTALRAFLGNVLPATGSDGNPIDVILAQQNRVPEPQGTSFVLMTPIRFERLSTNLHVPSGSPFVGMSVQQSPKLTIQLDFHSADQSAADMAQIVRTMFRDQYGTAFFAALPSPQNLVQPLYVDDEKMVPFQNDQQQWEWRWTMDCELEIQQTVTAAQTFADSAEIELIDVDATFPP